MLKIASFVVGLCICGSAFADQMKVDLTSFVYAGSRTRASEICGKVTGFLPAPGASKFVVVRITVDDKSDKPGVYNVLVAEDGAFCATVVSYYGTAVASIVADGKESGISQIRASGLTR